MKKTVYLALGTVLLALCILCALFLLRFDKKDVSETEQTVRETVDAAYQSAAPVVVSPEVEEPYVSPIDFASLQDVNPEVYAWLYIPNTDISYPLVQHDGDDTFYLNHDSEGNYYSGGAIFTEQAYNGTEFTDPVTVAYGHRMNCGTMFGQLQTIYSDPNGMANYSEIVVYLPERELHFTVFAAVPYDSRHILYNYNFDSSRMFNAFLDSVYSVREIGAVFNSEVTVSSEDQLLILSTCLRGNSQKRYIILAMCEEDIY